MKKVALVLGVLIFGNITFLMIGGKAGIIVSEEEKIKKAAIDVRFQRIKRPQWALAKTQAVKLEDGTFTVFLKFHCEGFSEEYGASFLSDGTTRIVGLP